MQLRGHTTGHLLSGLALASANLGDEGLADAAAAGRGTGGVPGAVAGDGTHAWLPQRVPREGVHRPRGRQERLGALLHAAQGDGRAARPVPAARQRRGARRPARDGRLGGRPDLRAHPRADAEGPAHRVRRRERDAGQPVRSSPATAPPRAGARLRPRRDLRPAGRAPQHPRGAPCEHRPRQGGRGRGAGRRPARSATAPSRRTSGTRSSSTTPTSSAATATRSSSALPDRSSASSARTPARTATATTCSSSAGSCSSCSRTGRTTWTTTSGRCSTRCWESRTRTRRTGSSPTTPGSPRPRAARARRPGLDPGSSSSDYGNFSCDHGSALENQVEYADSVFFTRATRCSSTSSCRPSSTGRSRACGCGSTPATVRRHGAGGRRARGCRRGAGPDPGWTERPGTPPKLRVNGHAVGVRCEPGTYASVRRTWRDGDVLELTLPMVPSWRTAPDNPAVHALTHGPLVLAGRYGAEPPATLPTVDLDSLQPVRGTHEYTIGTDAGEVRLRPFLDVHHEHYNVYFAAPPPSVRPPWWRATASTSHPERWRTRPVAGAKPGSSAGRPARSPAAGERSPWTAPAGTCCCPKACRQG